MYSKKDLDKISFHGVGLLFIIIGAVILAVTLAAWVLKFFGLTTVCAYPFFKAMGSLVIIGLGYLILEIKLLRKK